VRFALEDLTTALAIAGQGGDPVAARKGIQRRAYRSALDGTLQPYEIKTPADLDTAKRRPLFVYLHGSGEDERGQLARGLAGPEFVAVAPRGRGTSNAFSADHAQDDIREAIADAIANYPVDESRVVLAGFSMGGYGVYRTFWENPKRYRALAVFSGDPSIATRFLGAGHPDFLDPKYLETFRGIPVFVFHGGKDRNCPIENTRKLVAMLQKAGARVEFHCEEEKGHEAASAETMAAFRNWLVAVVQ
jgi:predicted esterase